MILSKSFWHGIQNISFTLISMVGALAAVHYFVMTYPKIDYGIWVIANSIIGWVVVVDFGLSQSFQNFSTRSYLRGNDKLLVAGFWTATFFILAYSIFATVIVLTIGTKYLLNSEYKFNDQMPILFFIGVMIIGSSFRMSHAFFRSIDRSNFSALQSMLRGLIPLIVVLLARIVDLSFNQLLYGVGLATLLIDLLFFVCVVKRFRLYSWVEYKRARMAFKLLLSPSAHFFIWQLGFHATQLAGPILISYFMDVDAVAKFNPTLRLSQVISGMMIVAVMPLISIFHKGSYFQENDSKKIFMFSRIFVIGIAFFSFLFFYMFANKFIKIWVGDDFLYTEYIYMVMGLATALMIYSNYLNMVLVGLGQQIYLSKFYAFFGALYLFLNSYLINAFNIFGFVCGLAFINFLTSIILSRRCVAYFKLRI